MIMSQCVGLARMVHGARRPLVVSATGITVAPTPRPWISGAIDQESCGDHVTTRIRKFQPATGTPAGQSSQRTNRGQRSHSTRTSGTPKQNSRQRAFMGSWEAMSSSEQDAFERESLEITELMKK